MVGKDRTSRMAQEGAFHEAVVRAEEIVGPSDRKFGLTIAVICGGLGAIRLVLGHGYWLWFFGIALGLVLFAVCRPAALRPLNRAWLKLGLALHKIVNPVIMTLLFVTTIAPIGLLMRLCGKDPLRLRLQPGAASYWIAREPPGPPSETMRHQF